MTREEFRSALADLGLSHSGKLTSALLGLKTRQIFNIAAGTCRVPNAVARVLGLLALVREAGLGPAEVADALGVGPERPKGLGWNSGTSESENPEPPGAS